MLQIMDPEVCKTPLDRFNEMRSDLGVEAVPVHQGGGWPE